MSNLKTIISIKESRKKGTTASKLNPLINRIPSGSHQQKTPKMSKNKYQITIDSAASQKIQSESYKELIKQYTKEELPFVDDIIEMAPGLHALYFLLKSGIIKKIEKNQSIIDIEISKEEMNKLDFEDCTRMKMIAFDDNFALMIGNKVEK